jgi:hypothetical protein
MKKLQKFGFVLPLHKPLIVEKLFFSGDLATGPVASGDHPGSDLLLEMSARSEEAERRR